MEKTVEEIDKECTEAIMSHMKKIYEEKKDKPEVIQALKALEFGGFHVSPGEFPADEKLIEAAKGLQKLMCILGWKWDLGVGEFTNAKKEKICGHKFTKITPDADMVCESCGIHVSILDYRFSTAKDESTVMCRIVHQIDGSKMYIPLDDFKELNERHSNTKT